MAVNLDEAHRVGALLVKAHGNGSAAVAGAFVHLLRAVDVAQRGIVIAPAQDFDIYPFHLHVAVMAGIVGVAHGQVSHQCHGQFVRVQLVSTLEQGVKIGSLSQTCIHRARFDKGETGGVCIGYSGDDCLVLDGDDVAVEVGHPLAVTGDAAQHGHTGDLPQQALALEP